MSMLFFNLKKKEKKQHLHKASRSTFSC